MRALMSTMQHPTAHELHQLVQQYCPGISLATVYNSLDYLCRAGVVNQHNLSTGPARYCVNITPHVHVVDERTGRMLDVHLKPGVRLEEVFDLPAGVRITSMNAYLHGLIPS